MVVWEMFDWALDEDTLYSNSDISNLESGKCLQKAVTNLECVVEDPGLLLSAEYNCFGRTVDSLQTDPIRLALTTVEPDEKMNGLAQLTAEAFLVAIRRHGKDYLDTEEGPSMSYHLKVLSLKLMPQLITSLQKVF